ncbi:hypothetical protein HY090_01995 [Candidatus Kaiserbacteria bacterium]|nr:hypothetical protein [Candidatus Kaiserbacteria bacterium]
MTLDELQAYIEERDTVHRASKDGTISDRERILLRMVKIMEEVGELSDAILGHLGHQRQAKIETQDADALKDELADVLITALLLGKALDIDVAAALENKIKKISNRTATYPF